MYDQSLGRGGVAKIRYLIRESRRNLKRIQEICRRALMFPKLDLSYLPFVCAPNARVCVNKYMT